MKAIIIAEAGINHNGDVDLAKQMIEKAKLVGADIWKTQLYDVDSVFPDKKIIAQDRNWYKEVKKTQLTHRQTNELAEYCKKFEIEFMASCFDVERLNWLEQVEVKRYKVASLVNKDKTLIDTMIATKKEILLSCNMYPYNLGKPNFYTPNSNGHPIPQFKLLYCVPKYPTGMADLAMPYFTAFRYQGFSDHTIGLDAAKIALARGAIYIERHFCLKRDNSNPDMVLSSEPSEFTELVRFAQEVDKCVN